MDTQTPASTAPDVSNEQSEVRPQPAGTLMSLAGQATISVERAGQLLGVGRSASYEAVRRGEIPVVRIGRRYRVPVPRLLAMLGVEAHI